ncbi:MAG: VCBS repeat-containing protein, partial [Saprospiraceae bacterium]
ISNNEIHWKINMDQMKDSDLIVEQKLPSIKLKNKFFKNNHNLTFSDISSTITDNHPSFSNGAAYGDFDNDGDLDIVVNNIRDDAFLYQNNSNQSSADNHHYLNINLSGPKGNPMAIGAKVIAYKKDEVLSSEQYPVRGYLSFVSPVLHLGLGNTQNLDSIKLVWPDHSIKMIPVDSIDRTISLAYEINLPKQIYHPTTVDKPIYRDITEVSGIHYIHKENEFVEFDREQLIPHMTSTEGPALAVGDINKDGLDDFFVGSSKRKKSAIYLQYPDGKFIDITGIAILNDSVFEDVDALFADIENDGDLDLVVASGGNEYAGTSPPLKQRIYLNDGKGNFTNDSTAIPNIYMTAGCVAAHDFNKDGFIDLFFGGRAVPWNYGKIPASYLFLNDGHGRFSDATATYAPALATAGLVKDGTWADMDHDGDEDLIIAVEWGPLQIYFQQADLHFQKKEIPGSSGWWNFVQPFDFDNDGDLDFVAGNLGLNSILHASADKPVRLYVNDFDHNGQIEQIMTYYIGEKEVIFPTHREITKQLPSLKKKFLFAKDFAKANLTDLVGTEIIKNSDKLSVSLFENSYYENVDNKGTFIQHPLPQALQFSPLRAACLIDYNHDGNKDILLGGNYYENNIELGRYDADYGSVLLNDPSGLYNGVRKSLSFDGQVRKIELIRVHGKDCYMVAFNNGPLKLIQFNP